MSRHPTRCLRRLTFAISLALLSLPFEIRAAGVIDRVAGGDLTEALDPLNAGLELRAVATRPDGTFLVATADALFSLQPDLLSPLNLSDADVGPFESIEDLVADSSDNLWIADSSRRQVLRVSDLGAGILEVVAGSGGDGNVVDGSPALDAPLGDIAAIAVSADGTLYITDNGHRRIWAVAGGTITAAAGDGTAPTADDLVTFAEAPAVTVALGKVVSLAVEGTLLWAADATRSALVAIDLSTGDATAFETFAPGANEEDPPTPFAFRGLREIAPTGDGRLFVVDVICSADDAACAADRGAGDELISVDTASGLVATVAGGGQPDDGVGDGSDPTAAQFGDTRDIVLLNAELLTLVDGLNLRLRSIDLATPAVSTLLGNGAPRFGGDGGTALDALLACPSDATLLDFATLLVADTNNDRIRVVDLSAATIDTFAGGGQPADGIGDGAVPTDARLQTPQGVWADRNGEVWIADSGAGRIRVIDSERTSVRTVAGGGDVDIATLGAAPALDAKLSEPVAVLALEDGTFWVADAGAARVYRGSEGGELVTVAGGGSVERDEVPGTETRLRRPTALARDQLGNLYIADEEIGVILRLDIDGIIFVELGSGGTRPDPTVILPAAAVRLDRPSGLVIDSLGTLWISDSEAHRVYRYNFVRDQVQVIAGIGSPGDSGDGGPAALAEIHSPLGMAVQPGGRRMFFADKNNNAVRRVDLVVLDPVLTIDPTSGSVDGGDPARLDSDQPLPNDAEIFFGTTLVTDVVSREETSITFRTPVGEIPVDTVDVTVAIGGTRFAAGTYTYLNEPPVAIAHPDGPGAGYAVNTGAALILDGTASFDPNSAAGDSVVRYEWNLSTTPTVDREGAMVTLSAEELASLGLGQPGFYSVTLRTTDASGDVNEDTASIRVADIQLDETMGSVNGGFPIFIRGPGLQGVTSILFDGRPGLDLAVFDPEIVRITVPTGTVPVGPVDVTFVFDSGNVVLPDAFTYTNDPPIARAIGREDGSSYSIRIGDSLLLDGSRSSDPNDVAGDFVARYAWDLDGDGRFDRRGAKVRLTPEELKSFGLAQAREFIVTLRVLDTMDAEDTDLATVEVKPSAQSFPNEDFSDWEGDEDGNKIDDALDEKEPAELVDVVVVFDAGTNLNNAATRLAPLSATPPTLIPLISALCLQGVEAGALKAALAAEGELFRAEEDILIEPDVDISAASIRAHASTLFSPETAEDLGVTGAGVNIAVLDSGVDDEHVAFTGKFVAGFNAFVDNPAALGSQSNPDDDLSFGSIFHGTHTAGVALGSDASFRGVAPGAKLIDVKVLNSLGQGSSGSLLAGIQWCINNRNHAWAGESAEHHGIDILSFSLGSKKRSDGKDVISMAVDAAVAQGLVAVASAGNTGSTQSGFGTPGAADGAITVGSTDDGGTVDLDDDVLAPRTNFGPRLDDGDADFIDELKPDLVAPGVAINAPLGNINPLPAVGFREHTGSSIASAHVAGVAALILELSPDLDPASVKSVIRNTAEPRGTPFDVDLDPTWNVSWGKGIVDAFAALPTDLGAVNAVWVSSSLDDNVIAIDPADPTPPGGGGGSHTLGGGREPVGISVDGSGGVWLACRRNATITKLNSVGQVRFAVDLGAAIGALPDVDLFGVAADKDGSAWLTLEDAGVIVRVNSIGVVDAAFYPAGVDPVAIAVDADDNKWIANSGGSNVTKLDAAGSEVVGSPFAVQNEPNGIVCDRDGRVYVANRGSDSVTILEGDGTLVGHFPAGLKPIEITLDFDGNIWVSNDLQLSVTRLQADGSDPQTFTVGAAPRGITTAGDGTLWVSIHTVGVGELVKRIDTDGNVLDSIGVGLAPINRGDGSGFVHANSVDPLGDADDDGWANGDEIDAKANPFDASSHPVTVTSLSPASGSVSGGTIVRLEGSGLDPGLEVFFGGAPATVESASGDAADVRTPFGAFPPDGIPVDVLVQFGPSGGLTLVDAYTFLNDPPIADPDIDPENDGYFIFVGDDLELDASASTDVNALLGDSIVRFEWDLNGNAVLGSQVTVTAAELTTFGMGAVGVYPLMLTVEDSLGAESSETVDLNVVVPQLNFVRGDANQDTKIDISDAIFLLNWLFTADSGEPPCHEAANFNADVQLDIADAIFLINFLFVGTRQPFDPYPNCGIGISEVGCLSSVCP